MTNTLVEMLAKQRELQTESFGEDPSQLEGEQRIEYIRTQVLGLLSEVFEMLNEVGWKPWATSRHVNEEAAFNELVDAWHFMMNLMWVLQPSGGNPEEKLVPEEELAFHLSVQYHSKRERNAQRQKEGYDGVSSKCPSCKRDYEETLCSIDEDGSIFCIYDQGEQK